MNGIILAAGESKRMGRAKMSLPFGNGTILSAVLDSVLGAGLRVFLVISPSLDAPNDAQVIRVINNSPQMGQASSLKIGLRALPRNENFCVMLGDLPLVTSEDITAHHRLFLSLDPHYTALVPRRRGAIGHPAFFAPIWIERFLGASGDVGGRQILSCFEEEIHFCRGEESFFRDIDTPDDYASLAPSVV